MTQKQRLVVRGGKGHRLGVGRFLGAPKLPSPAKGARGKMPTKVEEGSAQNNLPGTDGLWDPLPVPAHVQAGGTSDQSLAGFACWLFLTRCVSLS